MVQETADLKGRRVLLAEDVQRSMLVGLNAYLSKPVEPEAQFKTLEGLISRNIFVPHCLMSL